MGMVDISARQTPLYVLFELCHYWHAKIPPKDTHLKKIPMRFLDSRADRHITQSPNPFGVFPYSEN